MNRLKEIRTEVPTTDDGAGAMAEHLALYDPVRQGLRKIEFNTESLTRTRHHDKKCGSPKEREQNGLKMGKLIDETSLLAKSTKGILDEIQAANEKFAQDPSSNRSQIEMRSNVFNSNARAFHAIMNDYSAVCKESREDLRERSRRLLAMCADEQTLSAEQIEDILDEGLDQATKMAEQHIQSGDSMVGLANEQSERHDLLLNLERQVMEVFEMFKDLGTLVDLQGEKLELISTHVDDAKEAFKEANEQLKIAEKHQKAARSYKCYLLILLMVVLVVVVIILYSSGTFSSA